MSRGFTSSDSDKIAEFVRQPVIRDHRDIALDELRDELAATRADRDRWVARVKEL